MVARPPLRCPHAPAGVPGALPSARRCCGAGSGCGCGRSPAHAGSPPLIAGLSPCPPIAGRGWSLAAHGRLTHCHCPGACGPSPHSQGAGRAALLPDSSFPARINPRDPDPPALDGGAPHCACACAPRGTRACAPRGTRRRPVALQRGRRILAATWCLHWGRTVVIGCRWPAIDARDTPPEAVAAGVARQAPRGAACHTTQEPLGESNVPN